MYTTTHSTPLSLLLSLYVSRERQRDVVLVIVVMSEWCGVVVSLLLYVSRERERRVE